MVFESEESIGEVSFSKFDSRFSRPRKGPGTESLKFIRVYRRDSGSRNRLVKSDFRNSFYFTPLKHLLGLPDGIM